MTTSDFKRQIAEGIPAELPAPKPYDHNLNHAPKRKDILNSNEKKLAIKNALRYFPEIFHPVLAKEFAHELATYGRIYMYRFRPDYEIKARHLDDFPHLTRSAAAIMLMISNNLDHAVAQHPHELITYGGNGAVFQNWAQYRLTMKYLSEMTDNQTLVLYSGHPLGLFPSHADAPRLVVGSQARILYADAEGRMAIAEAFNKAIAEGEISAPVIIGRDHHDVSGTDSPYRETSDIYDGSKFTADMAVQNVIGDSFRGATWVSLHNGGGVGWGEVINGGFGMLLDGTAATGNKVRMMLHWDVNNGIARRSWARNKGAMFTLKREMDRTPGLKVTFPYIADEEIIEKAIKGV